MMTILQFGGKSISILHSEANLELNRLSFLLHLRIPIERWTENRTCSDVCALEIFYLFNTRKNQTGPMEEFFDCDSITQ